MGYFQQIFDANPVIFVITIILFIYAAREAHNIYLWINGLLNNHHKRESNKEDVNERIDDIACVSQKHTETLKVLADGINEIKDDMKDLRVDIDKHFTDAEEGRKADTRAMARVTLYNLYEELKDKETITSSQYESFSQLYQRYVGAGGNSTVRNKLAPYILNKPVSD